MDVNRLYAIGSVKEDFLGYVTGGGEPQLVPVDVLTGILVFYKSRSPVATSFLPHSFFFTTTGYFEAIHDHNIIQVGRWGEGILNMKAIMIPAECLRKTTTISTSQQLMSIMTHNQMRERKKSRLHKDGDMGFLNYLNPPESGPAPKLSHPLFTKALA